MWLGCARRTPITTPNRSAKQRCNLLATLNEANVCGATKAYGEIMVTTQVVGYQQLQWFTHERLGEGELDLPPTELHTTGYWLALTEATVEQLRAQGLWTNDPNDYGPNWFRQRNWPALATGIAARYAARLNEAANTMSTIKSPFAPLPLMSRPTNSLTW